jgi:protein-S-isoprenylcysteine O-methyltransferase Ste14
MYRYVRHPIYTGVLVLAAGIAVRGGSVLHLIAWTMLVAVIAAKARLEERLLVQRFPDYAAYMAATNRFVPRRPRPRGFPQSGND